MAIFETVKSLLARAQAQPWYPERKVIAGAVAGVVAALVAALGPVAAGPLVASLAAVAVAKVTAYLAKPSQRDVLRRRRRPARG